ncbi:hypothetical protein CDD82_2423 [Ophiocordyceps australis]|uniref:Uncharacterized protein n=1 Tax=Ophiocordyceps australis TaxID=1399860 RepID=A0A2C5ZIW4_9HYPO|nr:hypothetical protein CDD82_2423 [Ophiocordyceps australis]
MRLIPMAFSLAVLVAEISAAEEPISETELSKMISQLNLATETIDLNDPPYKHGEAFGEPTCFANWFYCSQTVFFNREVMSGGPYSTNVTPIFSQDALLFNDNDEPSKIGSTQSTAKLEASTKGWQISARIGVSQDRFTADINAQYKDETIKSTTMTKTVEYSSTCPPHKTCRIQTVTFKAQLVGFCADDPYLLCTNSPDFGPEHEISICTVDDTWVTSCSQYREYARKTEELCKNRKDPRKYCEVEVPLLDDKGEPLRAVVITHG